MEFIHTFAVAVLLLPVTMATVDLEFRCNQGNYVIKNPDTARYTGINGYFENDTACESNTEGTTAEILTVSDCGMERVQVDLLEGGSVGDTAVISCADGVRSMSGYSLPISFVIKSNSMLRSGSAHYSCHVSGIILVRNPRPALYINSMAYTMSQQPCATKHNLDNKLIEIYNCDMSSGVVLMTTARSTSSMSFRIDRKSNMFMLQCEMPPTLNPIDFVTTDNVLEYACYVDGTVVAKNPRTDLFKYSYAEQISGQGLPTLFVKNSKEIIIGNVDVSGHLYLVLSRDPIGAGFILRPRNVFFIQCNGL